MTAPQQSLIGIGLIILGLPIYYYLTNRTGGVRPEGVQDDAE
jgi:hypothetical protein